MDIQNAMIFGSIVIPHSFFLLGGQKKMEKLCNPQKVCLIFLVIHLFFITFKKIKGSINLGCLFSLVLNLQVVDEVSKK